VILNFWAEENDIMSDAQFGFKNNFSTVDPVFMLHSLIQRQLQNKKKLYCCFIVYKKLMAALRGVGSGKN